MGPEFLSSHDALQTNRNPDQVASHPTTADGQAPALRLETSASYDPNRVFFGASGLRAGWSLLVFGSLLYFFSPICGTILSVLVYDVGHLTFHARSPLSTIFGEAQWLAALLLAAFIVSRLERRRLSDLSLIHI